MAAFEGRDSKDPVFARTESTEYIGRAVASLAADPRVLLKTGKVLWVADCAQEYAFKDVDGRFVPVYDTTAPM